MFIEVPLFDYSNNWKEIVLPKEDFIENENVLKFINNK